MDDQEKNLPPPSYAEVTGQSSYQPAPPPFVPPHYVPPATSYQQASGDNHYHYTGGQFPAGYSAQTFYQQPVPNVGTTTVIVTGPNLHYLASSPNPVHMQCPSCGMQIVTRISTSAGALAFLLCILLALFGLWLGCCLLPFCIYDCMDVEHYCPNCNRLLGVYRRL